MTTAAPVRQQRKKKRAPLHHVHLPSVHIRNAAGNGYDYEEDLYAHPEGVRQVIRFAFVEADQEVLVRETVGFLCEEHLEQIQSELPVLMDEGNPAAQAVMQECARIEFERQLRIRSGEEQVCARCGCSETRACSGGCVWATRVLCSRCV